VKGAIAATVAVPGAAVVPPASSEPANAGSPRRARSPRLRIAFSREALLVHRRNRGPRDTVTGEVDAMFEALDAGNRRRRALRRFRNAAVVCFLIFIGPRI